MSWRATVRCSRAQGEAITDSESLFLQDEAPPVVVADEPDPSKPNDWIIHAYFEKQPTPAQVAVIGSLGAGAVEIEQLAEDDWIRLSQQGLEPIKSGRFHVHTPTFPPDALRINFEIDAGLAFGTGQHATTAGCLAALDKLECDGRRFTNIIDVGTGTGLLAFAALALWPSAKCLGSDIDPVAISVACENAAINGLRTGHGSGELLLIQSPGMDSPLISARAPFDLIIANILAGPLVELAQDFARTISTGGVVVLAGLLDTQVDQVEGAYRKLGFEKLDQSAGEWPVLVLQSGRLPSPR